MDERKISGHEALRKVCGAAARFLDTTSVKPEQDFASSMELSVSLCDEEYSADPAMLEDTAEIDGVPLRVSARMKAGKGQSPGAFGRLKPYAGRFLGMPDAWTGRELSPAMELYMTLRERAGNDEQPGTSGSNKTLLRFSVSLPSRYNKKFIGKKFGAMQRARELALQFLCSLEICPPQDFAQSMEAFLSMDVAQDDKPVVKEKCRALASEVWTRKGEIDGVLLRIVTGWRPERMLTVDRTILRMMVLECFLLKTLPVGSAMTEARNLADDYGTKDSSRFISGVMYRAIKYFGVENGNG